MFTGSTDVPGKVHFESAWKYSWCCLTVLSSLCCLTVSVSLCYPHFAVSFGCPYVSISCSLCLFLVCCVCAETLSDTAQSVRPLFRAGRGPWEPPCLRASCRRPRTSGITRALYISLHLDSLNNSANLRIIHFVTSRLIEQFS